MAKIAYKEWNPRAEALAVVREAEAICQDYARQGYDLTLRQLYYQFVARGLLPNVQKSYDRLGAIINDARMAGLLDWNYITDRTRNLATLSHWSTPADIIDSAAFSYRVDRWSNQPYRVEVWVEKEALAGVVGQAAERYDVAYFSCRGYVSQSEQWAAGQRLLKYIDGGQGVVLLHLGDHDPSGIDMTRDIQDRLNTFVCYDYYRLHRDEFASTPTFGEIKAHMREKLGGREPLEIRRIALNYDQVEEYNPPPNPAKQTDARFRAYMEEHGEESWELDALDPATLDALISGEIEAQRDEDAWAERDATEKEDKTLLKVTTKRWTDVADFLRDTDLDGTFSENGTENEFDDDEEVEEEDE